MSATGSRVHSLPAARAPHFTENAGQNPWSIFDIFNPIYHLIRMVNQRSDNKKEIS